MRRFLAYALSGSAMCACARAQTPQDLKFTLKLSNDARVYHIGERISLEIAYSSSSEHKYFGSWTSPQPGLESVFLRISPDDQCLYPDRLVNEQGFTGGSFIGSSGYVQRTPVANRFELTRWCRFQKPGVYTVTATSKEVWLVKPIAEGGGKEPLTLESNPVEFEIVPADDAWVAAQMEEIEQELGSAKNGGARGEALERLGSLDTPAAVRRILELYLGRANADDEWRCGPLLRASSHAEMIITALKKALNDPATRLPNTLPGMLADLEMREKMGIMPIRPTDAELLKQWTEKLADRQKLRDSFLAETDAVIASRLEHLPAPERAERIYQRWYDAEGYNARKVPTEERDKLSGDVLAIADALNQTQQTQFLILAWNYMPHEQLLPLIKTILASPQIRGGSGMWRFNVFKLYCEQWPAECHTAILAHTVATKVVTDRFVMLLLSEEEHPELDAVLTDALKNPGAPGETQQLLLTATLVSRVGSRNLVPVVDDVLDHESERLRHSEQIEADLIAYLYRFSQIDANRRLAAALQDAEGFRGAAELAELHLVRPSDEMVPLLTSALDSPNYLTAGRAALFLAEVGTAASESAIWGRLQQLWDGWKDKAAELKGPFPSYPEAQPGATSALEHTLASALMQGKNWKLGESEVRRLRDGCLTDACRQVADGKMHDGF
jgi:hypothetical protein